MTELHWSKKSLGAGQASYMDVDVYLRDVNITTRDISAERSYDHMHSSEYKNHPEHRCKVDQHIQSYEVAVYTEEELEKFRDLVSEYMSYYYKLQMDPKNSVLIEETNRLRQEIIEIYGTDIWFLNVLKQ